MLPLIWTVELDFATFHKTMSLDFAQHPNRGPETILEVDIPDPKTGTVDPKHRKFPRIVFEMWSKDSDKRVAKYFFAGFDWEGVEEKK